ncbi:hypothetical protein [Streptomyces phytophilus]|uniref:hypothetical protein n=1 Tax=Streptomyces phytophilus TaxID=722715 RepID=UPI0015F0B0D2|nr:hypothetical protein [Streptomyces phytophilus]
MWLPSAPREAGARTALAAAHHTLPDLDLVPVATTNTPATPATPHDPAAARWLPLDNSPRGRLPLAALTHTWPHLPAVSAPDPTDTTSLDGDLYPPPPMPPN